MYYGRRNTPPRAVLSEANLLRMGIPKAFFNLSIDDYQVDPANKIQKSVATTVRRYIDNIHDMFDDTVNLTIFGSNGSGKSFLTSLILKEAYRSRYSAKRITLQRVIDLKFTPSSQKDEEIWAEITAINNAEFLVLDEIGKEPNFEKGTGLSVFIELMKYREEKGLPTILCTNLSEADFNTRYESTIQSMVSQSVKLKMEWVDKRNDIFKHRKGVSILLGVDK